MAKEEKGIYSVVTVFATDTAPYHKSGEEVKCSQAVADKMIANGWATDKPGAPKKQKEV